MRTVLHKSNVYEMNDSSMDIDFGFYVPIANDDNRYNGFFVTCLEMVLKFLLRPEYYCNIGIFNFIMKNCIHFTALCNTFIKSVIM